MLRRLFKRTSNKKTEDSNHQAFVAAYTAMKPQWLDKQRSCSHLSPEEQDQVSFLQTAALKQLINNFGLDEAKCLAEYPLPLLNDNDLQLVLQPYEKEFDESFRREIGKIILLLDQFTIQGIERYVDRLDIALLSLAKNDTRKDLLNHLAVYYVPSLLVKDRGLINAYYKQYLQSRHPSEPQTLLNIFKGIIELMEADGHRANGISMDSIEMLQDTSLNNERRHQYIDGLDENLRILVPQPDHDSTWHAFKQEYLKGLSRLYPQVPLFGKPHNNRYNKPPLYSRNDNKNIKPKKNNYNTDTSYRNGNSHNNTNDKRHTNYKNGNSHSNNFTPSFLKKNANSSSPAPQKNSTSSNRNHNRQRKQAKYNHKINNVEAELQRQSSFLNDITSKLSLFDVPKVALTVVTLFALLCSSSAWTYSEQPPFYLLIYRTTYFYGIIEIL
uniref:NR LBD domain-containing protein n=1 Tax=Strongyloides papillosus TaxID=174720 RepID=A0A0N5BIH5_STREA